MYKSINQSVVVADFPSRSFPVTIHLKSHSFIHSFFGVLLFMFPQNHQHHVIVGFPLFLFPCKIRKLTTKKKQKAQTNERKQQLKSHLKNRLLKFNN